METLVGKRRTDRVTASVIRSMENGLKENTGLSDI